MEYNNFYNYLSKIITKAQKLVESSLNKGLYTGKYHSYPKIDFNENFPSFSQTFFTEGPTEYKELFTYNQNKIDLYEIDEVNEFISEIRNVEIFSEKYLNDKLKDMWGSITGELVAFEHTVLDMIECAIQTNGLTELSNNQLESIIRPIYNSIFCFEYEYDIYYPILFVKFDFESLDIGNYSIVKMNEPLLLARCHYLGYKLGAILPLESCATHALVIHNNRKINPRINPLFDRSEYECKEEIASNFFASLKIIANIDSGYSQIVFMPREYATSYYSNLPFISTKDSNEYPIYFKDYYWNNKEFPTLNISKANSVIELMNKITSNSERKIKIAVTRLQNCQKRTTNDDVILDAIIGIETLLSDGDKGELTYKLSMRVAALLSTYGTYKISKYEIYKCMKKIYDYRSAIVHGKDQKDINKSKEIIIGNNTFSTLGTSIEFLKDAILIIINNPKYILSNMIDELILT